MKDLSECRILIVDDAPANVDVLVQALRTEYKLGVAIDGPTALKTAAKRPPDLVLLDIVMPGLDGYEVCRQMRASPQLREVPIMFLSSLEDVRDKTRGFEAGGNDYLVKPFEILEVKARVRSLLKAKAYADAVKEKIAYDLRIAREIQMGILPPDIASVAATAGLEAHALLVPAQEVGGDLYEVLLTPEGNLVAVMGDVSGKGIPAALFMAMTTTLIRALAPDLRRPDDILRRVSDKLASHNPRNMFVTLLCATYEAPTGQLIYASAGHPAAVLIRKDQASLLPTDAALVAGILPGLTVGCQSVQLEPEDVVLFYTDGVTEAFNAAGNLYGESHLLEELTRLSGHTVPDLVAGLLQSIRTHAGEHPQSDDIAILALKRRV